MTHKQFRINQRITANTVRLVYSDGTQTAVVPLEQAMLEAERLNLDLIEVSPSANPPVCKLMDYGKFLYQLQKTAKPNKSPGLKEIQLRPAINAADLAVKRNKIIEFLKDGHRVKVVLRFTGRENAHKDVGVRLLQQLQIDLTGVGVAESPPRSEGKLLLVVFKKK